MKLELIKCAIAHNYPNGSPYEHELYLEVTRVLQPNNKT